MTSGALRGTRATRLLLAGIALAWGFLWFASLDSHPLFNPDEGRYAEIPREMVQSGNWLVPHLNDVAYIEKPPLQYWATAVSFSVFGSSVWAARFYTGLCGFLTVLIAAALASRLWGPESGWRAALMTGSSLLIVLVGHQLTLDMSLTFFTTAMVCAFCVAQSCREEAGRNRFWMRIAWVAAALAMLTKGLVALVLPGATLVIYSLLQGDRIVWRRLAIPSGLALLLLIALPWFVLIQREVPQFFQFFFVREHFARYLTRIADRYEPWWFFVPILVAGCLPWLVPAGRALFGGWRAAAPRGQFDARRFLWAWTAVTFCFFSASDSKLVPYILPMFPTLALLMAASSETSLRRDLRITGYGMIVVGVLLLSLAAFAPRLTAPSDQAVFYLRMRPYGLAMGIALMAGGLWSRLAPERSLIQTSAIAAASFASFALLLFASREVAPLFSGASLASQLPQSLLSGAPVFSVRTYDQTLPFYLRRVVTLVDERNEMDFGLTREPSKEISTLACFESQWQGMNQAFAVLEPKTLAEMQDRGVPMVVRARDAQRVVVSRR